MTRLAIGAAILIALSAPAARGPVLAQAAQGPTAVGTATDIPGVVRGGAAIDRILTGFSGLDDPIGLTDGSLVFSEPGARCIHRGLKTG